MMEIVGRILFIGGFFIAIMSQICIIALAFKNRYYEGLSAFAAPMYALISSDFRKEDDKVRILITLWLLSQLMITFGAYLLAIA